MYCTAIGHSVDGIFHGNATKVYRHINAAHHATLMTAVAVSLSGIIGLVGLIVPHLVRFIVGPDFRFLLPGSALMGGLFLLVSDNLARTLWTMEIPLGILTSLFGVPFFLSLLVKYHHGWD